MEKQIEIHAYHGWGFDSTFWTPIQNRLPEHVLLKPADRGYFGGSFEPEYGVGVKRKVLFLHSYGVHWCPLEKREEVDLIVVFNGFDSFHPLKNPDKSRSKKTLKLMEKQFRQTPREVLTAFYKNCFIKNEIANPSLQWMNQSILRKDLSALHSTKLKLSKKEKANWIIIDSSNDFIVPGKRGEELSVGLNSASYEVVQSGTHSLPNSNPGDCIKILTDTFPIFDR
ncbi:MAG: alpha/beta hydrolase [Balneola sp.]|nr:MAG: alpha/beta hydrolase [Balneola sp.]